jgi:hypothetical protein
MSYIVILMSFTAIFPSIGYMDNHIIMLRYNYALVRRMKSTASKSMSNLCRIIGLVLSHLQVVSKLNENLPKKSAPSKPGLYKKPLPLCSGALDLFGTGYGYGCMSRVLLIKLTLATGYIL